MSIQVITDSTSDIPQDLAEELGIRVVPIYIRFNDKVYRDGVDVQSDDFYKMLATSPYHPATSQPTPEDFASVYKDYCDSVDGIISVHISSKISGTCNSAMIARKMLESKCPIEVVDSRFNSAGLALVAMAAARLAKNGKSLAAVAAEVRRTISKVDMFGVFETMKYLARSGRVSKAIVTAANILNVMPLLTFREGEIIRAGLVRSFSKGMDRLYRFVESKKDIAELIIVHSAIPEQAEKLKKRLGWLFPEEQIRILKLGAGLGVHGGPGVLLVGLRLEE
ncbi:MAG TPA: DegV family protein [Dehalococcoidales bacterium]|nr:DegV family protein [Dehalococcoidales bacterium]